jgi:hypothetical protein
MANTVRADVTDLLAELGLTAPQDAEFVPAVPTDNLLELWRGDVHVTLDGSGNVSEWESYGAAVAEQLDPAKRPDFTTDPQGTGTSHMVTGVVPPASGYMVVTFTPSVVGGGASRVIAGLQQSATQRLYIATGTTGLPGASIGSVAHSTLAAGSATLRKNGVQIDAEAYTGGTGATDIYLFGRHFGTGVVADLFSSAKIHALAIYEGPLTTDELTAIDTAMVAFS